MFSYLVFTTVLVASVFGDVQWRAKVTTDGHRYAGTDNYVYLTIVGTKGRSKAFGLDNPGDDFQPGATNHFHLTTEDIGAPYEIIVKHSPYNGYHSFWGLHKIVLERDDDTNGEYVFECYCWIDSWDPAKTIRRSNTPWTVIVQTSDVPNAGTDGNIYINVVGSEGSTGFFGLDNEYGNFERNMKDTFHVHMKDIGIPKEITMKYAEHYGFTWHLNRVELIRKDNPENRYVFNCDCFFPAEKTEKTIQLSQWRVEVTTSDVADAGTSDDVYIEVMGSEGSTRSIELTNGKDSFKKGAVDVFTVSFKDIGTPKAVKVSTKGPSDDWHLAKIVLEEIGGVDDKYVFKSNSVITNKDGAQTLELYTFGCEEGWKLYQSEKKCLKTFTASKNFNDARSACQKGNADLVQVYDAAKNRFVGEVMTAHGFEVVEYAWIGVSNLVGGKFGDLSGNPLTYSSWLPGRPSTAANTCAYTYYDYRQQHSTYHLKWDAQGCHWRYPFTCEKDLGEEN